MTFWKYGIANDNAIETLLQAWKPSRTFGQHSSSASSGSSSPSDVVSHDAELSSSDSVNPTLEQLLDQEDLLQECKSGHEKLVRTYLPTVAGLLGLSPVDTEIMASYRLIIYPRRMPSVGCSHMFREKYSWSRRGPACPLSQRIRLLLATMWSRLKAAVWIKTLCESV